MPDDLLTGMQRRVKTHTLSGETFFDTEGAAADLAEHGLPAYFIDFETIQFAVPIWKGRPPKLRFTNWYIGKLHLAAMHDSTLSIAFLKVVNLMVPPPSLLSPALAWRVWCGVGSRRPSLLTLISAAKGE